MILLLNSSYMCIMVLFWKISYTSGADNKLFNAKTVNLMRIRTKTNQINFEEGK